MFYDHTQSPCQRWWSEYSVILVQSAVELKVFSTLCVTSYRLHHVHVALTVLSSTIKIKFKLDCLQVVK